MIIKHSYKFLYVAYMYSVLVWLHRTIILYISHEPWSLQCICQTYKLCPQSSKIYHCCPWTYVGHIQLFLYTISVYIIITYTLYVCMLIEYVS